MRKRQAWKWLEQAMPDNENRLKQLQSLDIRLGAIVLSVLFSLVVIAGSPIPNDDAFSYIKAAELFNAQGLDAALSTYGWYGYSVLISLTDSLLPLNMVNSAHLVNSLSFALLVYAFITLAMEYRQTRAIEFFAAVVILCFPTINEMRYYLVRDFAYWAFCLVALVQLIRFSKNGRLINAGGWLLAMAAAVFFRLEGLLILALSPFALLIPGQALDQRARKFLSLMALIFAGTLLTLLIFLLAGINLFTIFSFAYRWYLPLLAEYPDTLTGAAENTNLSIHISEQLEAFSGKGKLVLILGYLYSVLANIGMSLGPPASLFLIYGFISGKQKLTMASKWPWLLFLGSSLLALFLFVSIMQFLTTRYAVMTALLLLSLMPLTLESLYLQAKQSGKLLLFQRLLAGIVFFFLVDSLVSFGYSKQYIQDAINWSEDNLPDNSALLTNNFAVAYYSGRVEDYDKINKDPAETLALLSDHHYLVIDVDFDEREIHERLMANSDLSELTRFSNRRNDAIIVYEILSSP